MTSSAANVLIPTIDVPFKSFRPCNHVNRSMNRTQPVNWTNQSKSGLKCTSQETPYHIKSKGKPPKFTTFFTIPMNNKIEDLSPRETLFANAPLHPYEFMGFAALAHLQASTNRGVEFPSCLSIHLHLTRRPYNPPLLGSHLIFSLRYETYAITLSKILRGTGRMATTPKWDW